MWRGGGEIWKANTGEMVAQVGQHQHAEEETHEDARDGGLSQRWVSLQPAWTCGTCPAQQLNPSTNDVREQTLLYLAKTQKTW